MEQNQGVKKDGTEGGTPRYVVTAAAGYFKPLESLKNAKNKIMMYYQCNDECNPNSTAEARLQCKGSVNFSSIYLLDLKIGETVIGYGEPPRGEMLKPIRKKKRDGSITLVDHPNPFYESGADGYLFIITPYPEKIKAEPKTIEILIVPGGRYLIRGVAKQLADGQLNEALKLIRETAKAI
ncbi:MAG: hypothetical protein LBL07_11100 [Tannerella sp.]|jgi:hypothetical protein|nr:hypothetical protein [Tannerella sp.]